MQVTEKSVDQLIRDFGPATSSYQFKLRWRGLEDTNDEWINYEDLRDGSLCIMLATMSTL